MELSFRCGRIQILGLWSDFYIGFYAVSSTFLFIYLNRCVLCGLTLVLIVRAI
jgi:hypothetical protein